jgi:uncharacterized ion transporter superfamily protein YfcC
MAALTKLRGVPDSVDIFTLLGVEPWGRILLGLVELAAALLLLWPRTAVIGGSLGLFLMTGAIGAHLLKLGIMYGGGPSLFIMALLVFAASGATVLLRRRS